MAFDGYYVSHSQIERYANYFSNKTYGTDVPILIRTIADLQNRVIRRDGTIDEVERRIGRRNREIAVLEEKCRLLEQKLQQSGRRWAQRDSTGILGD